MDFDKYYKKDHEGTYAVHFLNRDRLNLTEIKSIFSSYGRVLGVNFTKEETGFIFIKYRTLQETINCLKGLKDGSKIQLLPERSKMNHFNRRMDKRDSTRQQAVRTRNSFQETFNSDKQLDSNLIHNKNLPNVEGNSTHIRTFNENNGHENFSNTKYQNSMQNLNVTRDNESRFSSVFNRKPSLLFKQSSMETNSSATTMDTNNQNFMHKPNLNVTRDDELKFSVFDRKPSFFSRQTTMETNSSATTMDTNYQNSMYKPTSNFTGDNELELSVFNKKPPFISRHTSMETDSSATTIAYEKYYRISKDDTYTVHFINKNQLTLEQINDLFLPYGNVLSIYTGGEKSKGLRFVRYKTLEEVKRCIKGLQNSDIISMLPQKDKITGEIKTTDQRSSNQWQTARIEDTSQRTFSTGKQFYSNSIYNERNGEKPICNTKTFDSDKLRDTDCFSDTASYSSRQGCKFNENEIKYKNTSPHMSRGKHSFFRQQNPMNNEGYNQVKREQQQEKAKLCPSIKDETDTKMDRNMQISTHDYKIPALISGAETKLNESVMPNSLLSNETRNSLPKIVPMQEIIVANIHMNYGVHYILHLFEKYDPISATLVKMVPENDTRYCQVYFKSVQDAVAVEEEFDNFELSGKNLIVLRRSRLIDVTICT